MNCVDGANETGAYQILAGRGFRYRAYYQWPSEYWDLAGDLLHGVPGQSTLAQGGGYHSG